MSFNGRIIGKNTTLDNGDSGIFNIRESYVKGLGPLFSFSSFTFTNGGKTDYDGPSLATLLAHSDYSTKTTTNTWLTNTSYFTQDSGYTGIQKWTVPATATYRITAAGAQGAYNTSYSIVGGYGAILRIDVVLTQGTYLKIVVGQAGIFGGNSSEGTGGGGGSFVYEGDIAGSGLIIAAGGGGGTDDGTTSVTQEGGETTGGSSARSNLNPTLYSIWNSSDYPNDGQDGAYTGHGGSTTYGCGAGWLNDQRNRVGDPTYQLSGRSLTSPYWYGGYNSSYDGGSHGGFGGAGANYDDGGSGGGFTGGGASGSAGGGAGGSYYAGMGNAYYTSDYENLTSNYSWIGYRGTTGSTASDGYVTIQKL